MVKLENTIDSKSIVRKDLGVQLPPSAQGGEKMKTKVLIIEDHKGLQKSYKGALEEKAEVVQVFTIKSWTSDVQLSDVQLSDVQLFISC